MVCSEEAVHVLTSVRPVARESAARGADRQVWIRKEEPLEVTLVLQVGLVDWVAVLVVVRLRE